MVRSLITLLTVEKCSSLHSFFKHYSTTGTYSEPNSAFASPKVWYTFYWYLRKYEIRNTIKALWISFRDVLFFFSAWNHTALLSFFRKLLPRHRAVHIILWSVEICHYSFHGLVSCSRFFPSLLRPRNRPEINKPSFTLGVYLYYVCAGLPRKKPWIIFRFLHKYDNPETRHTDRIMHETTR